VITTMIFYELDHRLNGAVELHLSKIC
jgi:hypothetical protein